jgi:hypothetical protein
MTDQVDLLPWIRIYASMIWIQGGSGMTKSQHSCVPLVQNPRNVPLEQDAGILPCIRGIQVALSFP